MDWSLFAFAFLAGNVAALNPCGIVMLPAFASYVVAGPSQAAAAPLGLRLWRAVRLGATTTVAFVAVFAAAGALLSLGARRLVETLPALSAAVGLVLVAYGLWVLAGRKVALRLPNPADGRLDRSAALFGVGYAIVSLSCTLPIFLSLVGATLTADQAASGLASFVAYAVGMGVVVSAVAVAVATARDGLVGRLRRGGRHLTRASGAVLVLVGVYVASYRLWRLGPTGLPTGDTPAYIRWVTDASGTAMRFVASPAGRWTVALLAAAVLLAATAGFAARRQRRPDEARATGTARENSPTGAPHHAAGPR
jgi:cytochrome c-type biogenesis protein